MNLQFLSFFPFFLILYKLLQTTFAASHLQHSASLRPCQTIMTSLLPIQYVTPHSITSTSASSVVELNSTLNTEKQQQQQQHSRFQQQQRWHYSSTLDTASAEGALPSVTVVKPRSAPTTANSNRLAYVDALVGTYISI